MPRFIFPISLRANACCTQFVRRTRAKPAAVNVRDLLQPTLAKPFNTTIVNSDNALLKTGVKFGKWLEYLERRRDSSV